MKEKETFTVIMAYIVIILFSLISIIPFITGLITAFKPETIQIASPPVWVFEPTLSNYERILFTKGNLYNLMNSFIVTFFNIIISLVVGIPAAYALARFNLKGSGALLSWIISLRMIPPVVVAIPFFSLVQTFNVYDTYIGLTLSYMCFSIPMVIWIMRGFCVEIPKELEESAMMDGCSRLYAIYKIVLPLLLPGIVATTLLVVMVIWNEYLIALILTGREAQTLPVSTARFITRVRIEWGSLFAANSLIVIPILILAISIQKHLVRGLTFGTVK